MLVQSIPQTQFRSQKLSPILKWAGGKEQELKYIIPNLPIFINNYFEPFVGGGAVYTAIHSNNYFINDKSDELISLYKSIGGINRDMFFKATNEIIRNLDLLTKVTKNNYDFFVKIYKNYSEGSLSDSKFEQAIFGFIITNAKEFSGMFSEIFNFNAENFLKELQINIIRKTKRMKQLEQLKNKLPENKIADNIETAFKSAFYMHFRHIYNHVNVYNIPDAIKSAIFLFIRNFAYSGMFRYNASGHFNVPYGGMGYNRKNYQKKVDYLKSNNLKSLLNVTTIENLDFEIFLKKHKPTKDDFIFLDPPYDSEFSTYAKNEFTKQDQIRLAAYLIETCKAKWMLIIKNTELMEELYFNKGLTIKSFDKTYLVSFMNRNDKDAEHLLITNY